MSDNNNYFLPFPRRLRFLLDETMASQTEVAKYVGVSRQSVSQWINGKTTPDCYNFKRVAEFFKVPLEYLYGDTDSKVSENIALSENLGLSDKAIAKMKEWANSKQNEISFPTSKILSDIIADDDFDNFIDRIRLLIVKCVEHRFHAEHESGQDFYENEQISDLSKLDSDNHPHTVGTRDIEDLTAFYQYQALQYLERVLETLPDEYYVAYRSKLEEEESREVELAVPPDSKCEYDTQLVKKHQTSISRDTEEKILSMYAKGMSASDIEAHIRNMCGLSVSDSTVSQITDKILPVVKEWQQRPLESVYAVVFIDGIYVPVRSEGQIVKKAVSYAIGIGLDGICDVLGMWIGDNESAKFWISILNSLRNRGVEDIFIACVDGLAGFPSAIETVYPKTEIQQCIIHQIRNTTRFVSYNDIKKLMADLQRVYGAVDEQTALYELDQFEELWQEKYPKISHSWRANWANLSAYFKYPQDVRTLIFTTNAIESFHRDLRKVTKSKQIFPTDDALLKLLYLAMMDITKKWTGRRRD